MKSERSILLISTDSVGSSPEGQISPAILSAEMYNHITELPSPPLSPLSPQWDQACGGMVRAKPMCILEESADYDNSQLYYRQQQQQPQPQQPQQQQQQLVNQTYDNQSHQQCNLPPTSNVVMSAQDWIQIQTHIGSLEKDNSRFSRTNKLLYQELNNVNSQMQRLTSQEGEGNRNEYEFLVQQIDHLHRQLQQAHRQINSDHINEVERFRYMNFNNVEQPDITKQLQFEVKELTKSLKNWQTAFQQAEEKYRRKCEGERLLKQTLRKRETQLSGLNERLSRFEIENECSSPSRNESLRLTPESETKEEKSSLVEISVVDVPSTCKVSPTKNRKKTEEYRNIPEFVEERVTITAGQVAMAILSWAVSHVLP